MIKAMILAAAALTMGTAADAQTMIPVSYTHLPAGTWFHVRKPLHYPHLP